MRVLFLLLLFLDLSFQLLLLLLGQTHSVNTFKECCTLWVLRFALHIIKQACFVDQKLLGLLVLFTRLRNLAIFHDFCQRLIAQSNNRVFRLQICVDDFANSMKVIQAYQDLLGNSPDKWHWYSFIIVSFHDFQQIYSKNLKHHNEVITVCSVMHERVEQLYNLGVLARELSIDLSTRFISMIFVQTFNPFRILYVFGNHIKNLDFVICSNFVARGTFLNFECHECVIVLHVFCKPDSGELSPTKLLHYNIPADEDLSQMHWVITSHLVLLNALIFTVVIRISIPKSWLYKDLKLTNREMLKYYV